MFWISSLSVYFGRTYRSQLLENVKLAILDKNLTGCVDLNLTYSRYTRYNLAFAPCDPFLIP